MSADKGSQDTDVSGNEAVETEARRGKKNEINKNINVQNYSDKKTDSYMESKNETFKDGKKTNTKSKLVNKFFDKGSKVTRTYYTDKVLKGTAKEKFSMLSDKDKEKQYASYLEGRTSGRTDAMGRVNVNYNKDNYDNSKFQKTMTQVDAESKAETETPKTTEEEEAAYKKRKGLVGSRSLFSTGGQRGFFN